MPKSAPTRYRTLNWSSYDTALRERGSLTAWFDPSAPCHVAPSGKHGAQPVYSDAAIQACLTVEVPFGLPLRQSEPMVRKTLANGFVASLLKLTGADWPVPDFRALCRRSREMGPWPQRDRICPSNAGRATALPRLWWAAVPARALTGHRCPMPCRVTDSMGIKGRGEGAPRQIATRSPDG